jgi:hypothetical protein
MKRKVRFVETILSNEGFKTIEIKAEYSTCKTGFPINPLRVFVEEGHRT